MQKWHSDDKGLCIHPCLCVEATTRLSQEMELHWEQPEEPRAGAAARTDASTDTTRLSGAEQAATRSEHEKAREQQVRTANFGAEGRARNPAGPIFRKNRASYVSVPVQEPPEAWPCSALSMCQVLPKHYKHFKADQSHPLKHVSYT